VGIVAEVPTALSELGPYELRRKSALQIFEHSQGTVKSEAQSVGHNNDFKGRSTVITGR
jgi:hypothetical protein